MQSVFAGYPVSGDFFDAYGFAQPQDFFVPDFSWWLEAYVILPQSQRHFH